MSATFQPDRMPGYVLPTYAYRPPPELAGGESPLYPVAVVGAGLGGLTAALELGRRGVCTVLLDDDDTVGAQGLSSRGICHAQRSLEIYDRFGMAEKVRAKGVTWNEGDVFVRDERIFRFDLQPERDQKFRPRRGRPRAPGVPHRRSAGRSRSSPELRGSWSRVSTSCTAGSLGCRPCSR
jgi:glycine/D-amino acid oxidase-like deaminating enzyme